MAKDSVRLQYKVDSSSIENFKIVKSRFPRSADFNNLLFYACEGLVRMGTITNKTVLTSTFDPSGDDIPIHLDKSLFPAITYFYDKCPWGLKRKALGLAMTSAINLIADDTKSELLDKLISVASSEWENIGTFDLPDDFFTESESKASSNKLDKTMSELEQFSKKIDDTPSNDTVEPELEDELEVDEDILADLAGDIDISDAGRMFFDDTNDVL